eukprot:CAMPEP_0178808664 /NCGR_PEP_ID=MMETSP0745-20121128/17652_1 /TAXON_ID=913974 /ORGANISM="Nitzschia punctata, Strain CCMP561" /LENGTH=49 /DNA_ID=CAMNT_0020468883 /DNA_START=13 /DNA_END=162 /DNA_ORIENTATION=-
MENHNGGGRDLVVRDDDEVVAMMIRHPRPHLQFPSLPPVVPDDEESSGS